MEVRFLQPQNVPFSIDVTLVGMMMEVRLLQAQNVPFPIDVTLVGMLMEVRPLQPANALSPIDVTPGLMVTDMISLLFLEPNASRMASWVTTLLTQSMLCSHSTPCKRPTDGVITKKNRYWIMYAGVI